MSRLHIPYLVTSKILTYFLLNKIFKNSLNKYKSIIGYLKTRNIDQFIININLFYDLLISLLKKGHNLQFICNANKVILTWRDCKGRKCVEAKGLGPRPLCLQSSKLTIEEMKLCSMISCPTCFQALPSPKK